MSQLEATPPDQPEPAGSSGDPRVDAAFTRLARVTELSGPEQVAEYEAVHRILQDTLSTIDEA